MISTEEPKPAAEVHSTAVVGDDVKLGEGVHIGPFCVIGDGTTIGGDDASLETFDLNWAGATSAERTLTFTTGDYANALHFAAKGRLAPVSR